MVKKEFVCKPAHNKNFLKTKIKSHGDEVTVCYHKKIPNEDSNHTYLSVIGLEFTRKKNEIFICKCFNSVNTLRKKQLVILMIFLLSTSLMKNVLEQVNLITLRSLSVIQNLQYLIR